MEAKCQGKWYIFYRNQISLDSSIMTGRQFNREAALKLAASYIPPEVTNAQQAQDRLLAESLIDLTNPGDTVTELNKLAAAVFEYLPKAPGITTKVSVTSKEGQTKHNVPIYLDNTAFPPELEDLEEVSTDDGTLPKHVDIFAKTDDRKYVKIQSRVGLGQRMEA